MAEMGPDDPAMFELTTPPNYERVADDGLKPPVFFRDAVPDWEERRAPDPFRFSYDRVALDSWLAEQRLVPQRLRSKAVKEGETWSTSQMKHRLRRMTSYHTDALTEAVGDLTGSPVSAVGRFTAAWGDSRRFCTAFVVATRVIATAAHCVFRQSDGKFADWTIFEAQASESESAGEWAGLRGYAARGWVAPVEGVAQGPFDYAFVIMDGPVAETTGTLGVLTGRFEGAVTSLGYPRQSTVGYAFDGRYLYASTGSILTAGVGQVEAQNGLTEGASGGPWLVLDQDELLAAGLNASKPVGRDDVTYSPMFAQGFMTLLSRVLADLTGV